MKHVFKATKLGWEKEKEGIWFDSDDYTAQEAKDELKTPHSQATVDEAASHLNAAIEALAKAEKKETYVLMNIPYAAFYRSETTNNDVTYLLQQRRTRHVLQDLQVVLIMKMQMDHRLMVLHLL